jgi:hypothetical protein
MSDDYEWRERSDRDVDVLALVCCALDADYEAATSILETLDRGAARALLCRAGALLQ